jgi:hypothetical protein
VSGGREGEREDKSETIFFVIISFVFEFLVFVLRADLGQDLIPKLKKKKEKILCFI